MSTEIFHPHHGQKLHEFWDSFSFWMFYYKGHIWYPQKRCELLQCVSVMSLLWQKLCCTFHTWTISFVESVCENVPQDFAWKPKSLDKLGTQIYTEISLWRFWGWFYSLTGHISLLSYTLCLFSDPSFEENLISDLSSLTMERIFFTFNNFSVLNSLEFELQTFCHHFMLFLSCALR